MSGIRDRKLRQIVREETANLRHELQYDNGQSVKDAVARVESGVADLLAAAALQTANDAKE